MKENKIEQLIEQVEDQLDMLHQDFTTVSIEKVKFELEHAKKYTEEEKIKLKHLSLKESYVYDQIYLFNDIKSQLEAWSTISRELNIDNNNFIEKIELFKSFL